MENKNISIFLGLFLIILMTLHLEASHCIKKTQLSLHNFASLCNRIYHKISSIKRPYIKTKKGDQQIEAAAYYN